MKRLGENQSSSLFSLSFSEEEKKVGYTPNSHENVNELSFNLDLAYRNLGNWGSGAPSVAKGPWSLFLILVRGKTFCNRRESKATARMASVNNRFCPKGTEQPFYLALISLFVFLIHFLLAVSSGSTMISGRKLYRLYYSRCHILIFECTLSCLFLLFISDVLCFYK